MRVKVTFGVVWLSRGARERGSPEGLVHCSQWCQLSRRGKRTVSSGPGICLQIGEVRRDGVIRPKGAIGRM